MKQDVLNARGSDLDGPEVFAAGRQNTQSLYETSRRFWFNDVTISEDSHFVAYAGVRVFCRPKAS